MNDVTTNHLPEDIARRIEAQVASGHFANAEDALRAGMEALDTRQEAEREWASYLRQEFLDGIAEIERGECIRGTPGEIMAILRADVKKLLEEK